MSGNIQYRIGFRWKKQIPLFMVWAEERDGNEVINAWVIFNSEDWIGI